MSDDNFEAGWQNAYTVFRLHSLELELGTDRVVTIIMIIMQVNLFTKANINYFVLSRTNQNI